MELALNTELSDLEATADTDFPPGCGCALCCNGGQRDAVDFHEPIKDLVIMPGGGGTITPASVGVHNAGHLLRGLEWGPGGGTAASVTFSFLDVVPAYYSPFAQERVNFQPFTAAMKNAAREVMDMVENIANVTLTEVSGVGDITFGQAWLTTSSSAPGAWAYYPDQGDYGGDIWTNNNFASSTQNVTKGTYGFYTLLHEVGHALGLQHSFSAGLTGNENTEQYTVMAYDWSKWGSTFAQTHMLYDISALQQIYGANTTYNTGSDIYALVSGVAQTIWDAGGEDTIDTTGVAGSVTIHLEEGGFSSVGETENVAIAYGAVIENATTGGGNDLIYGNAANNILNGGAGNDQYFGVEGNDSYVYISGLDTITETSGTDKVIFDSSWNPWDTLITGNVISLLSGVDEITFNDISLIEYFAFDGYADMTFAELNSLPPPNTPPVAQDDDFTGDQDVVINGNLFADNGHGVDSDPDSDPLNVVAVTGLATTQGGSVDILANGNFTYTPAANFNGADSFNYTLEDGQGGSDTGTVNLTINAVNDDPIAQDDNFTGTEDLPVNGNVLLDNGNGVDSDTDGDPLNVVAVTGLVTTQGGSVDILSNGDFTYTPTTGFNGADSFSYTLQDGQGGSDIGTVNLTINAVDNPPVVTNNGGGVDEDNTLNVTEAMLSMADSDTPAGSRVFTLQTTPTNGTLYLNAVALIVAATFTQQDIIDGLITYNPNANFNGADSFNFTASDGTTTLPGQSFNINVASINDDPTAQNDGATTDEDVAVNINVLTNDSDIDGGTLSVSSATGATNGITSVNTDNTITYIPNANFNGADSFTYTLLDGQGGSHNATVNVTVNSINDDPTAQDDDFTGDQDIAINGNLLVDNGNGADSDIDGGTLNVVAVTGLATTQGGSVDILANGDFTYTPATNFSGADSFTYTLEDGQGGSDVGTVNLTINVASNLGDNLFIATAPAEVFDGGPGNDTVDFRNSTAAVIVKLVNGVSIAGYAEGDTLISIENLTGSDFADTLFGSNFANTLRGGAGGDLLRGYSGVDILHGESGNDTLDGGNHNDTLYGEDGNDVLYGQLGNDVMSGGSGNDDLVGNRGNDTYIYTSGADVYWEYTGTDRVEFDSAWAPGDVSIVGNLLTLTGGNQITFNDINLFETFSFDGFADMTLTELQNFGGGGGSSNNAPLAQDDDFTGTEDTPINGNVIADNGHGVDSDPDGDPLNVVAVTALATTQGGSVDILNNGNFTYTPSANFNGSDSFTYTLQDGQGGSDTGTVNLTINAANDDPTAQDDNFTGDQDTAVNGNLLVNNGNGVDSDTDGDPLNVVAVTGLATTQGGSVDILNNGDFIYTPTVGFNGADSFSYTLQDGQGGSDIGTVNLTINPAAGSGDDTFFATAAAETFDGGDGNDAVDYGASTAAVIVKLVNGVSIAGYAEGDTLISIENLTGSDFADTLFGSNFANTLRGGAGGDLLRGYSGVDILHGESGNDTLDGGNHNDTLYGEDGNDVLYGYWGNDTMIGGAGNDDLVGHVGNDTLDGGDGNDKFYDYQGNDIMTGGAGSDLFLFYASGITGFNDAITDFSTAEGDVIDLSNVLTGYDPLADLIADFVQITDNGTDSFLAVDADGGANNFVQIATLQNVTGLTDEDALETSGNLVGV